MEIKEILKLLEAGKKSEAKKKMKEYLAKVDVSKTDIGEFYAEAASMYVKMQTEILKDYNETLEAVLKDLRDFNIKAKILTPK